MVKKLLQPQEIEVFYVLPALRRELAVSLKTTGKSQKDIAKLLGVTEAAVSQYFSSKRASRIQFSDGLKRAVNESAAKITDDITLMNEMQRLLQLTRTERVACQVHCMKGCNACYERSLPG
ncbi:Uncharacterised protein [uncultured archaeon]|nr:Uncharacterised protein [uncultured archaeon]